MAANRGDDILQGPRDPSWILFEHVRPIVETFLERGRVISIDDVLETARERRDAEERIAEEIKEYLQEGLPHLYATQQFFDGLIRRHKIKKVGEKEVDIHFFDSEIRGTNQYRKYYQAYAKHMERLKNVEEVTAASIKRMIENDPERKKLDLTQRVYLAFKHGAVTFSDDATPQVVLEISRIKELRRVSKKFSRYMCLGLLNYDLLLKQLKKEEGNPRELKKRIRESLGAMHAHELKTPFAEKGSEFYTEIPDAMEFLLMACRVSDIFGTVYVGRSREDAIALIGRLTIGRFERSAEYQVLKGKRLRRKYGLWQYVDDLIIDDHMRSRENLIPGGNMNIFTYIVPRRNYSRFHIRIDTGVYGIRDHIEETGVGIASHLRYEREQEKIIEAWETSNPKLYRLYKVLCNAVLPIVEQLTLEAYPLFRPPRQMQGRRDCEIQVK